MKIVFMGTPDFAVPSLHALTEAGYAVAAVVTQPDKPKGRGKTLLPTPVKEEAVMHDIPVYQPEKVRNNPEFLEILKEINPEIIVVAAYGQIIPKEILELPKFGCINIHASLLPKYRGAAPIQRVIIDGEKETGVTIMQLDEGMDTGNIISTVKMAIPPHMNAGELFDQLGSLGARELIHVLDDLPEKLKHSIPQNQEEASYAEKITKDMGHLDWNLPAERLDCLIRGMNPNPGTYSFYRGKRVKIHKAAPEAVKHSARPGTILSLAEDRIHVACGSGALVISEIQPENHKKMDASDFIHGYQVKVNDEFDR